MLTGRAHPLPVVMLAFSIALGMSGCVAPTPDPTPSTSAAPSPSPLFNSDEEALAAATEAYAAYLAASNAVGQGGWQTLFPIEALVTEEALADDVALAEMYRAQGYVQAGATTFDSLAVQSYDASGATAYLCLDASQADLLDASGTSVVDRDQPRRVPLEVEFTLAPEMSSELLVGRSEVWSGKNFC